MDNGTIYNNEINPTYVATENCDKISFISDPSKIESLNTQCFINQNDNTIDNEEFKSSKPITEKLSYDKPKKIRSNKMGSNKMGKTASE